MEMEMTSIINNYNKSNGYTVILKIVYLDNIDNENIIKYYSKMDSSYMNPVFTNEKEKARIFQNLNEANNIISFVFNYYDSDFWKSEWLKEYHIENNNIRKSFTMIPTTKNFQIKRYKVIIEIADSHKEDLL